MRKRWSLYLMSALYIAAGIAHFASPQTYLRIVPVWVPDARAAVLWSGVAELVLGAALLVKRLRFAAAIGIMVLLIAIFPANIKMAGDLIRGGSPAAWLAVVRLPLQAALLWWAWKVRTV